MPAAAVIPAPIAYINVVAVKKLVVGFLMGSTRSAPKGVALVVCPVILEGRLSGIHLSNVAEPRRKHHENHHAV